MTRQTTRNSRRRFLSGLKSAGCVAIAGSILVGLTACGQKGPLYLPGDGKKKKKQS